MRRRFFHIVLSVFCALGTASAAHAQAYPNKPIKLLVGIAAGGATDVIARLAAKKLADRMNQPVVVENRAGAGGMLAAEAAAKSPPDGYTLLLGTSSLPSWRYLYPIRFSPEEDLVAVGGIASSALVLMTKAAPDAPSVTEFVARARAKPNSVSFSSSGVGGVSHLATESMLLAAGVQMLHVPYKSSAAGILDVISGRIDLGMDGIATALPQIKANALKPLGVTSPARSSFLPDVPTLQEAGIPGYALQAWLGLFLPAGTPKPIVDTLSAVLHEIASTSSFRDELATFGLEPFPMTSAELSAKVRSESEGWSRAIPAMKLDSKQ
ncbi:MAG: Bug family tripartite tricarboxylate transporter substrate binding protein [Lautropia sp.]